MAAHLKESGHWYDQNGNQIAQVPKKTKPDELKATTIREAREMGLCRGVTSIIGLANRPDLERWKIQQAILACIDTPYVPGRGMTEKDYLDAMELVAREGAAKAADKGSQIHAAIQAHLLGEDYDPEDHHYVAGTLAALDSACGMLEWKTEVPVVSRLGYGTKIDLCCPGSWLLDIKTKDGDTTALKKMKLFESYPMQLAAGARALKDTTGDDVKSYGIVLVSRDHPRVAVVRRVAAQEMEIGWQKFRCLLDFSFLRDGYRPPWAEEE